MQPEAVIRRNGRSIARMIAVCSVALACAPVPQAGRIPPAPIALRWPDPAFLPERQCQGAFNVDDLTRYLPRAHLALWLPSTRAVALDTARRCITVTVETVGTGRLAELVLRGVAVPRSAILLQLTDPVVEEAELRAGVAPSPRMQPTGRTGARRTAPGPRHGRSGVLRRSQLTAFLG